MRLFCDFLSPRLERSSAPSPPAFMGHVNIGGYERQTAQVLCTKMIYI
jgi:hypothetical protein